MPGGVRVPGYLGQVLDDGGEPVGSCFEVSPGVLVTAWHVLDDLGRSDVGDLTEVSALGGGESFRATVRAIDPMHDLAVLTSEGSRLGSVAVGLWSSDDTAIGATVVVTGVSQVADPDHTHDWLDAPGVWAGGTVRDREVPLGRIEAKAVMAGMSGAPVRTLDGDRVVGVVSGRYNSADGWLRDSVWVARTENLEPLLTGLSPATVARAPVSVSGPVTLRFTVDAEAVRLSAPRGQVSGRHQRVSIGLARRIDEVRRRRGQVVRAVTATSSGAPGMTQLSDMLRESFLPEPVAGELARLLDAAAAAHERVLLGVEARGEWAALPWEALAAPASGRPLAPCPLVDVYRAHPTRDRGELGRPLRILVAIASPETGGGELLDYEKEMRSVLAAVRGARQARAEVRFVPFASTAEIRKALDVEPVHVLHVSCHGRPGALVLEDDDGNAREVDADTFVDEAIPPGRMPAVLSLAACHTDTLVADEAVADEENEMRSFAAQVAGQGPVAVIATEASVTDEYATRLFARVYARLASDDRPDVVAAVSEARRIVQRELAGSKTEREQVLAGFDEWATVTVLANGPAVLTFDGAAETAAARPAVVQVGEVLGRGPGEFVGRRREQRRWPGELLDAGQAGMVLFGIGGVGKTTLATELTRRVLEREATWIPVGLIGFVSADRLLGAVCSRLRTVAATRNLGAIAELVEVAARPGLPADERLRVLREAVFPAIPVLVLLDNFEDNLGEPSTDGTRPLRDEALASLLAAWVGNPGESRLLITTRFPVVLPDGPHPSMVEHQVGPMSLAETRKLMWTLPNLDTLDAGQAEQVWRMLGGHPRSLEYLDALLAGGKGRFPDITRRLALALETRLGAAEAREFLRPGTDLQTALTETVALSADDILIGTLVAQIDRRPGARSFLIGASVYRRPVDRNALLFQSGHPDESAASTPDRMSATQAITAILDSAGMSPETLDPAALDGDLRNQLAPHVAVLQATPLPPYREPGGLDDWITRCRASSLLDVHDGSYAVHRWTATILADEHTTADELAQAHQRAAAYWRWHFDVWPQDRHADIADLIELRYHHLAADDIDAANRATEDLCLRLEQIGAWDDATATIAETLTWLSNDHPRRAAYYGQLGNLAYRRGDYAEAEHRYRDALAIFEQLGDQALIATGYHQLGMLAQDRGDFAEAERRYHQSLDIKERLGNQAGLAASYHQLGMLAQDRGDFAEAERRYHQSLDIKERLGNQAGLATSYHQLGVLAQRRGDHEEAERRYHQSLDIKERLGNQAGLAAGYHQLGTLAQDRGDFAEAERRYHQSLDIKERVGNPSAIAITYSALGDLAWERNDPTSAVTWYTGAAAIRLRLQVPQLNTTLSRLSALRRATSRADFDEGALAAVDNESLANLHQMLDEVDAAQATQADNEP